MEQDRTPWAPKGYSVDVASRDLLQWRLGARCGQSLLPEASDVAKVHVSYQAMAIFCVLEVRSGMIVLRPVFHTTHIGQPYQQFPALLCLVFLMIFWPRGESAASCFFFFPW